MRFRPSLPRGVGPCWRRRRQDPTQSDPSSARAVTPKGAAVPTGMEGTNSALPEYVAEAQCRGHQRKETPNIMSDTNESGPIEVVVRDAANARINKVEVLPDVTAQELLQSAIGAWKLPEDFEYVVRVARLGRQVLLSETMTSLGVVAGDVLEIQALAEAGASR